MINEIDKILAELLVYERPDLLSIELPIQKNKGKNFSIKKLNKYSLQLNSINWFLKKISKYELYFLKFYPKTTDINKHEALEHHVCAYLEDLNTLKNKLIIFVDTLKNDLKKIALNKNEIDEALKHIRNQIHKAFDNVAKNRNHHRHAGYRFVDNHIVDGEVATRILANDFPLKDRLTDYERNKMIKLKKESFEKGSKYWSENSLKNYKQVYGLSNEVLKRNKEFLFKVLDIKLIDLHKIKRK